MARVDGFEPSYRGSTPCGPAKIYYENIMTVLYPYDMKPCPNCTKECPNIVNCVKSQFDMRNLARKEIQTLHDEIKQLKLKLKLEYKDDSVGVI